MGAVTKSIETGRKMDLSLKDLESFLASEGMEPTPGDAKKSAQLLLDLRLRELRRLNHLSKEVEAAQEDASNFTLMLGRKSEDEVKDCFSQADLFHKQDCVAAGAAVAITLEKAASQSGASAAVSSDQKSPKEVVRIGWKAAHSV